MRVYVVCNKSHVTFYHLTLPYLFSYSELLKRHRNNVVISKSVFRWVKSRRCVFSVLCKLLYIICSFFITSYTELTYNDFSHLLSSFFFHKKFVKASKQRQHRVAAAHTIIFSYHFSYSIYPSRCCYPCFHFRPIISLPPPSNSPLSWCYLWLLLQSIATSFTTDLLSPMLELFLYHLCKFGQPVASTGNDDDSLWVGVLHHWSPFTQVGDSKWRWHCVATAHHFFLYNLWLLGCPFASTGNDGDSLWVGVLHHRSPFTHVGASKRRWRCDAAAHHFFLYNPWLFSWLVASTGNCKD